MKNKTSSSPKHLVRLHQLQLNESLQALEAVEALEDMISKLTSNLEVMDIASREVFYRAFGDLIPKLNTIRNDISDSLYNLIWVTNSQYKKDIRSRLPKNRRYRRLILDSILKGASSGLPGDDDPKRPSSRLDADMFYFNTTNSGGNSAQDDTVREESRDNKSIYDVDSADLGKHQDRRMDEKDWSRSEFSYPSPVIPKVVRR